MLPPCDWPPDRAAPGELERLRRFCNTANLESGADRLGDVDDFMAWLTEQAHAVFRPSSKDLERCVDIRESLRAAAVAHRNGHPGGALADFARQVEHIRFVLDAEPGALRIVVDPRHAAVDRYIGSLALAVINAGADGTWPRLKACRCCRWVVYDHSKNRSVQWCSMSACGGRSKVREHRARQRASERTENAD